MNNVVDNLTADEIKNILNSGIFLTSTKRKVFQDRLEFLSRQSIFPNNRTSKITHQNNSKELISQEFPQLMPQSRKKQNKTHTINYSGLLQGTVTPVVSNILDINYDDIIELFHYFAEYRIKLYLVTLRYKISLLKSVNESLKKYFEYDRLVKQENIIHNCILICTCLDNIMNNRNDASIMATLKNLLSNFRSLVPETTKCIENFNSNRQYDELQKELIKHFDPKIKCEYLININEGKLIPVIVYSSHIVDCDEEISHAQEFPENQNCINDKEFLQQKFNQMYDIENYNNFFSLSIDDRNFYVRYEMDIHKNIRIIKNGVEVSCLTSYISVQDNLENITIPKHRNFVNNWLKNKVSDVYHLDAEDYEYLNEEIRNAYSLEETRQNIFYVDYMFDYLSKKYPLIINPQMLQSFKKLAFESSR